MSSLPKSFYWYDLETSGLARQWDRIVQFAGQRTNAKLELVGDPLVFYVKLPDQVVHDPESALITGIVPSKLIEEGITEWEAINLIHEQLSQPGTCTLGYNSIGFDDHFIRYALYRNLFPPYEREYTSQNSRADLYPMVLATAALRPNCLNWPKNEEDGISFSLANIAEANGVDASDAHDAYSDIQMSIEVARRIAEANPKMWRYFITNRKTDDVKKILNSGSRFFVHINRAYGSKRCCAAPVQVVAQHPTRTNTCYVADLSKDLSMLEELNADELAERRFLTSAQEEERGVSRLPITEAALNQFPIFVPTSKLTDEQADRLLVDTELLERNIELLNRVLGREFHRKMRHMLEISDQEFEPAVDAAEKLYETFPDKQTMRLCKQIHAAIDNGTPWPDLDFKDPRYIQMSNRLHHELRPEDFTQPHTPYIEYVKSSLRREDVGLLSKQDSLKKLREQGELPSRDTAILNELANYYEELGTKYSLSE